VSENRARVNPWAEVCAIATKRRRKGVRRDLHEVAFLEGRWEGESLVLKSLASSYPTIFGLLPTIAAVFLASVLLWGVDRQLLRRLRGAAEERRFARQLVMLALTLCALVIVILTLPVSEETRGQLIGLLGLAVTAALTLSSATFVSNAMAGLMLRSVGNMRPGDFVRVGDQFGRVTVRGLFHTEIQTPDRDLTTLPNLFLVSNPVTVVRESGTIVSCEVSLGYDNAHTSVEPLLVRAAEAAGLKECFVLVTSLDSFSVGYRVAGFLEDVSSLLSSRSALAKAVLDQLHGAGIEIMSPTFMGQRQLAEGIRIVPGGARPAPVQPAIAEGARPEEVAFDKAEEAGRIDRLRRELDDLQREIASMEKTAEKKDEAVLEQRRVRAQELADAISAEESRQTKTRA
jgi:small conductance mechanosensitive channel